MMTFEERYALNCRTPSDINRHLPILQRYASFCTHVTEFGVRHAMSTTAFIAGCKGEVHSYDIMSTPEVTMLKRLTLPCLWYFHLADTTDPNLVIARTDFLFFDTLHTYDHLRKELAQHARRAVMYLGFHDTAEDACGILDKSGPDPTARGILPAIEEFLAQHHNRYETEYRTEENNGLWILKRKDTNANLS